MPVNVMASTTLTGMTDDRRPAFREERSHSYSANSASHACRSAYSRSTATTAMGWCVSNCRIRRYSGSGSSAGSAWSSRQRASCRLQTCGSRWRRRASSTRRAGGSQRRPPRAPSPLVALCARERSELARCPVLTDDVRAATLGNSSPDAASARRARSSRPACPTASCGRRFRWLVRSGVRSPWLALQALSSADIELIDDCLERAAEKVGVGRGFKLREETAYGILALGVGRP